MGRTAGVIGFVNTGRALIPSLTGREAMGYAGVANAGDEDGMGSVVMLLVLNIAAGAGVVADADTLGVTIESRSSIPRSMSIQSRRIY